MAVVFSIINYSSCTPSLKILTSLLYGERSRQGHQSTSKPNNHQQLFPCELKVSKIVQSICNTFQEPSRNLEQ